MVATKGALFLFFIAILAHSGSGQDVEELPIPAPLRCIVDIVEFVTERTSPQYIEMWRATGKDIDNYGNYTKCKEQEDLGRARYIQLVINTTAIPIKIVFGLCLPRTCTQEMYNSALSDVTGVLNAVVPKLVVHISAADNLILPTSTYEMYAIAETEYQEGQREEKKTGAIVIIIFLILFATTAVASGIYEEWEERKGKPGGGAGANKLTEFEPMSTTGPEEMLISGASGQMDYERERIKFSALYKSGGGGRTSNLLSQVSTNITDTSGFRPFSVDSQAPSEIGAGETKQTRPGRSDAGINKTEVGELAGVVRVERDPWYWLLMRSFSCRRNWKLLIQEPRLEQEDGPEMKLWDFVRTISIIWIMALSTCFFVCTASMYNPWTFFDLFKNILFTVTVNAALAFDVFCSVSALFAFYKIANYAQKSGAVRPMYQYFLRLFRIIPLYYFVFFAGWMLGQFMGNGPVWSRYRMNFHECSQNWWSVLLFASNFYPSYMLNNEGCFFWSWAVCCDMQFFVLIPPIVWCWRRWPRATLSFVLLVGLVNVGVYIWLFSSSNIDMKAGIMAPQNQFLLQDIVSKPYTKGCSFALGILMGAFVYDKKLYNRTEPNQRKQKFPKLHALHESTNNVLWFIGYQLSLAMLLFLILITFKANSTYWSWSQLSNALYLSLSRPLFIAAVYFFFIAIYVGRLTPIKNIFGSHFFTPIGRLTFALYLIHPLIILMLYITVDQSQYLRLLPVVLYLLSFILISTIVAVGAFLLVEAPLSHQFRGVISTWCTNRNRAPPLATPA